MLPPGPLDGPPSRGRLVLVFVAHSGVEAYAMRGRLEAEGIPVFLKGESEGPYRIGYGPVYTWVPEEVEVQARLVIAQAVAGALSLEAPEEAHEPADRTEAEG